MSEASNGGRRVYVDGKWTKRRDKRTFINISVSNELLDRALGFDAQDPVKLAQWIEAGCPATSRTEAP